MVSPLYVSEQEARLYGIFCIIFVIFFMFVYCTSSSWRPITAESYAMHKDPLSKILYGSLTNIAAFIFTKIEIIDISFYHRRIYFVKFQEVVLNIYISFDKRFFLYLRGRIKLSLSLGNWSSVYYKGYNMLLNLDIIYMFVQWCCLFKKLKIT